MKFALELPLQKNRDEVWKAFDNPENLKMWQPTLVKFENVSGTQGQPGAVSKLTYKEGKREFFLIEKVTHRAKPDRLDGVYENEFADNSIMNTFVAVSENETLWRVEVEYKFKTLFMRLIGPSMKTNFILRAERDMQRFKAFVEKP
ncbi:MAG: SRPBCC family protein [Chloroflexi bacterium]|nr:SRPBCC family protein [Chloroflexota bacterium]